VPGTYAETPPNPLRSRAYPAAAQALGRAQGYDNPHRREGHLSSQEVKPAGLEDLVFYEPDEMEAALRERLAAIRRARGR
jgi:replication-associated recombination protein RarA